MNLISTSFSVRSSYPAILSNHGSVAHFGEGFVGSALGGDGDLLASDR